jgi:hypothetical protein
MVCLYAASLLNEAVLLLLSSFALASSLRRRYKTLKQFRDDFEASNSGEALTGRVMMEVDACGYIQTACAPLKHTVRRFGLLPCCLLIFLSLHAVRFDLCISCITGPFRKVTTSLIAERMSHPLAMSYSLPIDFVAAPLGRLMISCLES